MRYPYRQPYYHPGYYSRDGTGMTLKEKIQYSLLGIIVVGGALIVGGNAIRKAAADNEQKKTLDDGSAATYAKQIRMAFENDGWWGTDVTAIRNAMRAIPNRALFREVLASYAKLYNKSLLADMQDELTTSEYQEMLYIISAKPESGKTNAVTVQMLDGWARRLKAAFDASYGFVPGTDEDAIKAVFMELPTQQAFMQTAMVYSQLYNSNLADDLKGELEFWEYDSFMQMIYSKPKV